MPGTSQYDVNLRGPVFLVQYALPHLIESPHAAVVNVLSAGAFLAAPAQSMYAGAKAALMAFTRAQAREWAPLGIRVNALAPGTIDTDMVRNNPPEAQARMAAASPMNRAAHADEMIGPVMFLVLRRRQLHDRSGRARRRRDGPALSGAGSAPAHDARPRRTIIVVDEDIHG